MHIPKFESNDSIKFEYSNVNNVQLRTMLNRLAQLAKSSLTSTPSYDKALMIETMKSMIPLENDERFIEVTEVSSTLNEAVDKMIDEQSEDIQFLHDRNPNMIGFT